MPQKRIEPERSEAEKGGMGIAETCKRLGVSKQRIGQLIEEGRIRPIVPGHFVFTPQEVERCVASRAKPKVRTPAGLFAEACALFEKGTELLACTKVLHVGPTKVRALYEQWKTPLRGNKPKTLEELAKEADAERVAFNRELDEQGEKRRREANDSHERMMRLVLGTNGRLEGLDFDQAREKRANRANRKKSVTP